MHRSKGSAGANAGWPGLQAWGHELPIVSPPHVLANGHVGVKRNRPARSRRLRASRWNRRTRLSHRWQRRRWPQRRHGRPQTSDPHTRPRHWPPSRQVSPARRHPSPVVSTSVRAGIAPLATLKATCTAGTMIALGPGEQRQRIDRTDKGIAIVLGQRQADMMRARHQPGFGEPAAGPIAHEPERRIAIDYHRRYHLSGRGGGHGAGQPAGYRRACRDRRRCDRHADQPDRPVIDTMKRDIRAAGETLGQLLLRRIAGEPPELLQMLMPPRANFRLAWPGLAWPGQAGRGAPSAKPAKTVPHRVHSCRRCGNWWPPSRRSMPC